MIKHGTKYINESEWFDEVNLSDLYDESTGRFKRNPPLGTRVRVVIPGYDGDEGKEITGEVVKYYNDKEDLRLKDIVFALMLDGGWQQEFGWGCDQEWGLRKYDGKCYWIDVEDDEVYLEKPPLPVVDIVESEGEDDLEWAQDAIDNPEYRYGDIVNDLDNDDIISLTGIITDSEGNPMVEVRDSEFRVYKLSSRRDGKYVHLQWSQPSDERPSNWDDIGATVIMSPETFEWDKDLRVRLIHKENHPF